MEELRRIYIGKGIAPDKEIIAYLRIGERSSHTMVHPDPYPGLQQGAQLRRLLENEHGSIVGAPIE